jgi:hypothetical protein
MSVGPASRKGVDTRPFRTQSYPPNKDETMHGPLDTAPQEAVASVARHVRRLEDQGLDHDQAIWRTAVETGVDPDKVRWCTETASAEAASAGSAVRLATWTRPRRPCWPWPQLSDRPIRATTLPDAWAAGDCIHTRWESTAHGALAATRRRPLEHAPQGPRSRKSERHENTVAMSSWMKEHTRLSATKMNASPMAVSRICPPSSTVGQP